LIGGLEIARCGEIGGWRGRALEQEEETGAGDVFRQFAGDYLSAHGAAMPP
jgi:hypothetical protein